MEWGFESEHLDYVDVHPMWVLYPKGGNYKQEEILAFSHPQELNKVK